MLEIFEELDEFLNNRTANFFNEFAEMYRLATKNTDKDSFSKVSRIYSALNTLAAVLTSHRHLIRAKIKEYEALNENVEKYFFGTTAD
jgi:hypothetical protein